MFLLFISPQHYKALLSFLLMNFAFIFGILLNGVHLSTRDQPASW